MTTLRNQTEGDLIEALVVFVREYLRLRLGHWEVVRSHIRKWPRASEAKSGKRVALWFGRASLRGRPFHFRHTERARL
jgi:hypothetical protein